MNQMPGRRRFLALISGVLATLFIGEGALAAKKPLVKKKVVKKPVKKAPAKEVVAKPTAKPTPAPSPSATATAVPTPTATPTINPTATPTPASSASPSPQPAATIAAPPSTAQILTAGGKDLMVASMAIGGTVLATFLKNNVKTAVLVTRVEDRKFIALKPICTHAGGPVYLSDSSLLCEWHFSRFSQKTGEVINGPASEPLAQEKLGIFSEAIYYLP